jgi:hypothetical protein
MNLEMLGEEDKPIALQTQVSTGKKNIVYDEKRASIEQIIPSHLTDKSYILRATEYAKSQGFNIVKTLKEALLQRDSQNKTLTFREADIVLRGKLNLNNEMIAAGLFKFGGFLCEESQFLTDGVFELRARWNKGLEWKRTKRPDCKPEQQSRGDKMLEDIEKVLIHLGFPLHAEEKEEGFDKEFMKPEYLSWDQFHAAIAAHRVMSIEHKEQRKETEQQALGVQS